MLIGKKDKYHDLEEMFLDNEKLVYIIIREYISDEELIKELSQAVWYKVFLNYNKFKGKSKKDARDYLRALVKNFVADYFKEQKKEAKMLEAVFYFEEKTFENSAEDMALLDKPLIEYLDQAYEALEDDEKQLIKLKYHNRLKSEDIGELLGISAASVRVKLQRIREKLKKEIERLQGEDQNE